MAERRTGVLSDTATPFKLRDHSLFVGFAPANGPKIVVAVMLEYGGHGTRAAQIASRVIEHYLKVSTVQFIKTEGE